MSVIPIGTVKLLWAWGRWGSINIGYPVNCPMFVLTGRSPRTPVGYIPADVLDIENAVRRVEVQERRLIVLKYQWRSSLSDIAKIIDATKWSTRRKIEAAEGAVHDAYCALGTNPVKGSKIETLSLKPA
jgi:hypothetical protein